MDARVDRLSNPFRAEEEEKLVPVFIEVGSRKKNRAANIEAWKVIIALGPFNASLVRKPVIGIQFVAAPIIVTLSVKLRAPRF